MNEKRMEPLTSSREMESRLADGSLFDDDAPLTEACDDALPELDDAEESPLPNLKLSHGDEADEAADFSADDEALEVDSSDDDADRWPWDSDIAEATTHTEDEIEIADDAVTGESLIESDDETDADDDIDEDATDDSPLTLADEDDEMAAIAADLSDHSAIEDVVLSTPMVQTPIEETLASFARKLDEEDAAANAEDEHETRFAEGPARAVVIAAQNNTDSSANETSNESAASIATGQPRIALTPKRIGSGQLVPARLTWRPGDPFGDIGGNGPRRFRWDVMLTSAGVTAACGLACIWLLRTLLA